MKVLISWHAAVEQTYRKLFTELSLQGVDLQLIAPPQWIEGGDPVHFCPDTAHHYPTAVLNIFFTNHIRAFFYPNVKKIFRIVADFQPDIIHIMEEPFSLAAAEFLLAKKIILPSAKTVLFSFENINFTQRFPYSFFQKFNLANADAITIVPKEGTQIWRSRGFNGNIFTIPLGIDTETFFKKPGQSVIKKKGLTIGYVGRIIKEKDIDIIIDALHELKQRGKPCCLYIVGSGDYEFSLQKKVEDMKLNKDVTFLGQFDQKHLPYFYSEIDILILPSKTTKRWKEQFGRVLVEAMACETAVIGSSSGDIPEVIGDAGLVFPEGDVRTLIDHIEKLMKDRIFMKECVERGKERVMKNYSWAAVAVRYKKMYNDIL